MCAPWMDYGRFWSADLGLLCYYVRYASEGHEYDVACGRRVDVRRITLKGCGGLGNRL